MTHTEAEVDEIAKKLTKAQRRILAECAARDPQGPHARFEGRQQQPLVVLHAGGLTLYQDAWLDAFNRTRFKISATDLGRLVARRLEERT